MTTTSAGHLNPTELCTGERGQADRAWHGPGIVGAPTDEQRIGELAVRSCPAPTDRRKGDGGWVGREAGQGLSKVPRQVGVVNCAPTMPQVGEARPQGQHGGEGLGMGA
ncbi:MAG: hypothetical protein CMJ87_06190 [Planctomycetes bacterium]|nr:hypothetical protein [Planctomycetota bacterium]